MDVIVFGKSMRFSELQPRKAPLSIVVSLSGTITVSRAAQPLKAYSLIVVMV